MELGSLLEDLERLEGGAWSDRLLQSAHQRSSSAESMARHTALLRQALEDWIRHDWILRSLVRKNPRPRVRAALRLGLLLLESGHPAHAAVDGVMRLLHDVPVPERGLVNAVLRNLLRQNHALAPLPAHAQWTLLELEAALALPQWFLRLVTELEGPAALRPAWLHQMKQQLYRQRGLWLRVNAARWTPVQALAELQAEGLQVHRAPEHDHFLCLAAPPANGLHRLAALQDGRLRVQDLSSAGALLLLDAQPGMRVLDLCAAPGGKSLALLDQVADLDFCAVEADPGRCRALERRLEGRVRVENQDALTFGEGGWDRILLDVPCSGSGTVGHRPDILRKADPVTPQSLALQSALLRHALALLAPGARLVYSTCSLDRRENGGVALAVARELGFHPCALPAGAGEVVDGGWLWRPWRGLTRPGRPGAGGAWAIALERDA